MIAFYGFVFLFGQPAGPVRDLGVFWSTMLLVSSSAAALATLTAPKRRDPDDALIVEFWASVSLCILMGWFLTSLFFWYRTDTGNFASNTAGLVSIFFIGFGARAW